MIRKGNISSVCSARQPALTASSTMSSTVMTKTFSTWTFKSSKTFISLPTRRSWCKIHVSLSEARPSLTTAVLFYLSTRSKRTWPRWRSQLRVRSTHHSRDQCQSTKKRRNNLWSRICSRWSLTGRSLWRSMRRTPSSSSGRCLASRTKTL